MDIKLILLVFISNIHCIFTCTGSFPGFCSVNQLEVGPSNLFGPCNDGSGHDIPKNEASKQPTVKYPNAKPNAKYILVMRDPDTGDAKDVLHWLLTDISSEDIKTGAIDKYIVKSYWGPNPPGGQHHRYQIMLFEQKTSHDLSNVKRIKFETEKFLKANNLCPSDVIASFQFKSY